MILHNQITTHLKKKKSVQTEHPNGRISRNVLLGEPKGPETMEELTILLENDTRYSNTAKPSAQFSHGQPFYSGTVFANAGQSAVVFTSPTTIEALTMMEEVHLDGTFDSVPATPRTLYT